MPQGIVPNVRGESATVETTAITSNTSTSPEKWTGVKRPDGTGYGRPIGDAKVTKPPAGY